MDRGSKLYRKNCVVCHGKNGTGKGKRIPPLAQSDYLLNNIDKSIRGIKYGLKGEIMVNGVTYDKVMKPSGLTDPEITDIMNFILNSWDNTTETLITVETVKKVIKQ
ncbi:cytochrome c [Costertonia aggregata]|uniref:Cytochrome c n=2 Tax=Costertonia aggregata TaxID=343403 RepID=A0A7H9AUQ1_9FLAO|nr:cytochrome c [Costertonia aggregata]